MNIDFSNNLIATNIAARAVENKRNAIFILCFLEAPVKS